MSSPSDSGSLDTLGFNRKCVPYSSSMNDPPSPARDADARHVRREGHEPDAPKYVWFWRVREVRPVWKCPIYGERPSRPPCRYALESRQTCRLSVRNDVREGLARIDEAR